MRRLLPLLILSLSTGCGSECDAPQVLDGRSYRMFGNLVDFVSQGDGAPLGVYPVNGYTDWTLNWGVSDVGPVDISIDGQPINAQGEWAPQRCNTFNLALQGDLIGEEGVRHIFESTGEYLYYDGVIEGRLTWDERWTFGESSGTITASEAVVIGTLDTEPIAP